MSIFENIGIAILGAIIIFGFMGLSALLLKEMFK